MLNVYASPLPFSNKQIKVTAFPGNTLQDIVDLVTPHHMRDAIEAVVLINGQVISPDKWRRVRPKEGAVVNVNIIPAGGGGKKNPLASLLSIAVMIAAPQIGAAFSLSALNAGIGLTAGQGILLGQLVSGAVGIVGRMLVSQLAPPPKPSNAGLGNANNPAESPTQFIEGASNSLNPFGVVPVCLGTNRMFPLQAARPYTETQNNDQYVRQLFTYGYGTKLAISDLKIGETAISQFTNIQIQHRLNGDLHQSTGLYSQSVLQDEYSVLLTQAAGYTIRTTQSDADEAIIDVTFPQGLCSFNDQGVRGSLSLQVEVQYSNAGESPTVWSPGVAGTSVSGTTIAAPAGAMINRTGTPIGYSAYLVVLDRVSGAISLVGAGQWSETQAGVQVPVLPDGTIRLSTVVVRTNSSGVTIMSATDDRQASIISSLFGSSTDFLVSTSGTDIIVASGTLKNDGINITGNQTEALRRSIRIRFPASGTYDIRIKRITADTSSDQIFDQVYLTAIKTVRYEAPVEMEGINGTAIRVKATDQLNGVLDQFNCIVSNVIPDYDSGTGTWLTRITSNPASIYRYVLQGLPNAKALSDAKIDLDALAEWHTYCATQGYSYNRVIDYETSVAEILRDVAAAGAATPAIVDGKRTVAIDRIKSDIVQVITPRNSWGYRGEMTYPELPHAFRVQFRNADKGYQQDERIVYDDGYDENNATIFETLELQSCTNSDLAFMHGRRHIASVRLRPETHTFMMDVENLVAIRGDRIKFAHDIPIVGIGDGRIKTVTTNGESPTLVTGFTIDDTVTIPDSSTYYVRIRLSDGTQLYKELVTTAGPTSSFTFATPFWANLQAGDLCYFVEAGGELDLLITRIEPQEDLSARITCINYDEAIFTAESAEIPVFESHITTPLELIRPDPPLLVETQSDESVMIRNSDGTLLSRAIITLENTNEGIVEPIVKIRVSGTDLFTNASVQEASAERVVITGLQDNTNYDVHIRYRRRGSALVSTALEINNFLFEGTIGAPEDVTGFTISITDPMAVLRWTPNEDIDLSHYKIKYSARYSGATWATAQLLADNVTSNSLTIPFQGGTYFIKAVDIGGSESDSAATIITYDPGALLNAVETITEHTAFAGVKDNVEWDSNSPPTSIVMTDPTQTGYYYFANSLDLGAVYTSLVSARIVANGAFVSGSGNNDIFAFTDIFAVDDIFGIGEGAWDLQLQYRTTLTDPNDSPANWSAWQELTAGNIEFRAIEFRLQMTSADSNITPQVTELSVSVDMPDRIERGEDLTVTSSGATITYPAPFKANPAVVITLQDADANDRIEYTAKSVSGFSFRVYNSGESPNYVTRTYDYIASGYGREN